MRNSFLSLAGRWLVTAVLGLSLIALIGGAFGSFSPDLDLLANARSHLAGIALFAALALWLDYRPVLVLTLGGFLTLAAHTILAQQAEAPLFSIAQAEPDRKL